MSIAKQRQRYSLLISHKLDSAALFHPRDFLKWLLVFTIYLDILFHLFTTISKMIYDSFFKSICMLPRIMLSLYYLSNKVLSKLLVLELYIYMLHQLLWAGREQNFNRVDNYQISISINFSRVDNDQISISSSSSYMKGWGNYHHASVSFFLNFCCLNLSDIVEPWR